MRGELVLAFVLGMVAGSFTNVVIYRVPMGLSVVSYLKPHLEPHLEAGGRSGGGRISVRYPLVEVAMGMVWVGLVRSIGLHPELAAFLAFGTTLVILSAIDLEHCRLPNQVLGPAAALAVVLLVPAAAVGAGWTPLEHAVLGAVAYGVPMLVLGLAAPSAMGGGDVKFAPYLGFHLGWLGLPLVAIGALFGMIAGALGGVVAVLAGKKGIKDAIPLGPFMALGALVVIFVGPSTLRFWLGG